MALPNQCPLCSSGIEHQRVITSHVFGDKLNKRAFYQCENCDVFYQYPGLSEDEEKRFYNAEFEKYMSSRSGADGGWLEAESHIIANEKTVERRLRYILPELSNSYNSLLEIGSSSGFMIFPFQEKGFDCIGIEPSGIFGEFVRSKGVEVFDSLDSLKHNHPNKKFDIIQHFFVLEHIADPLTFLKEQLSLLNEGGKIILEIPNVADPLYSIYDIPAFERFYWSIAHPWYFSEKSLRFLLNQLNTHYDIILDQRYDLSNHMVWARDGKPGGMGKYSEMLGSKIENLYKESLIENGHCDTLVAIITKK